MLQNVFIIMPAYNAELTVASVFSSLTDEVKERIAQFVVVNDGSSDKTEEVLEQLAEKYDNLVVLRHEQNKGYGAAEKTLLNYALEHQAEAMILLHSDGQYTPEKIPEMLRPFDEDQAEMVQGSRMLGKGALKGGMPYYKFFSNKCLTWVENRAFGMKLAEYHSGYMAYSLKTLQEIPFNKLSDSFDFDLEMIVMAKVKGLRLMEIPIPTIYADEVSHLNPIKYGLDVLSVVKAYRQGKYHVL